MFHSYFFRPENSEHLPIRRQPGEGGRLRHLADVGGGAGPRTDSGGHALLPEPGDLQPAAVSTSVGAGGGEGGGEG